MNETKESIQPLSAADRCDICGAQAYIRAVFETGELIFCGHHGNENKAKLVDRVMVWHDQTADLDRR
ncbi:MAG: hypothetical protein RL198_435 [Actinomycetota bacterium]|jgi:hypothetical protein